MLLNPAFITDIKTIINTSREKAIRAVDTEGVLSNYIKQQIIYRMVFAGLKQLK